MKKQHKFLIPFAAAALLSVLPAKAGNEDRAGQAGAQQLLINPWARSSGWGGANSAGTRGLEAQFFNVAGTAFTRRTELLFCHTNYLGGTDIGINAFGLTQRVGETGAIGLSVMALDAGDIMITTVDLPEGGLGTFHPTFNNIGISYAKGFSESIYGGMTLRILSESTADVSARGVSLDAGIQYVTGEYENIKFGIALKNVGPRMHYAGDGLTFRGSAPSGNYSMTLSQRSQEFELPSLVNIGASYDLYVSKDSASMKNHRITFAGTFTSNSFSKDEFRLGVEYSWRNILSFRGGYIYEKGITKADTRTTVYTGPCAGLTFELPFGEKRSTFGLDYSYRPTNPFNGVHSFGARINL